MSIKGLYNSTIILKTVFCYLISYKPYFFSLLYLVQAEQIL